MDLEKQEWENDKNEISLEDISEKNFISVLNQFYVLIKQSLDNDDLDKADRLILLMNKFVVNAI